MNFCISNIAWDVSEDKDVAYLLNSMNVSLIDLAPSKYFPNFKEASKHEIVKIRQWWNNNGIKINGMQSLLFGITNLNIFGSENDRKFLLDHLREVCRIGSLLGAKKLVFGSPKNRDRSKLSNTQTSNIALDFFYQLGEVATNYNLIICLEPNPTCYGCNFLTTTLETEKFTRTLNHKSIMMQLDTGAMIINEENFENVIEVSKDLIGHIHLSEVNLMPILRKNKNHLSIAPIIKKFFSNRVLSIEMLSSRSESNLKPIKETLEAIQIIYS
jgi:D-psicose/D-tagatose/L-ribulose 3-epimerase